jgi:hypothetical protein
MTEGKPQSPSARRLTELRSALPYDATLQNLITVLQLKLDLCARLPVFEYEASSEGFGDSASFFQALATIERETVQDTLRSLQVHLERTGTPVSARTSS